jgi:murein lipoprotein
MLKWTLKPVTAAALIFAVAGCASNQELQSVRGELADLKTEVSAARADSADAKAAAERAEQTAEAARMQSMQTDEKIDRMFKKSMYK